MSSGKEIKKSRRILFLIVGLICLNIIQLTYIFYDSHQDNLQKSIIGTYCTTDQISIDNKYFVFNHDGEYLIYKQSHPIEQQGKYQEGKNGVYSLEPSESGKSQSVIFDGKDTVYYVDSNHHVTYFYRLNDTPTYINVSGL